MIIAWHKTGPRLRYERGIVHIEDLNPEAHITWRVSRWELFRVGIACIGASFFQDDAHEAATSFDGS